MTSFDQTFLLSTSFRTVSLAPVEIQTERISKRFLANVWTRCAYGFVEIYTGVSKPSTYPL